MSSFEKNPLSLHLPDHFIACIQGWYGKSGEDWLSHLPQYLEQCAQKWNLEIGSPMQNLSANYVTNAVLPNGEEVILKISPEKGVNMEMEALKILQSHAGIIDVLHFDDYLSAMVLEKVSPGKSLREIQQHDDLQAIHIAAPIIRDVVAAVPPNCQLRTVSDEMEVIKKVSKRTLNKETERLYELRGSRAPAFHRSLS